MAMIFSWNTYDCVYCSKPVKLFRWQNKRVNIAFPRGSDFARDDGQAFAAYHGRCERQEQRWMDEMEGA